MKFLEDLPYVHHCFSDIMPMMLIEVVPQEKVKFFKVHKNNPRNAIKFNVSNEKLMDGYDLVDSK